ncbi:hypothetical protein MKZ38_009956 [Zalerion maritima]|uniref:Uncharacterized protein n=1 Tax=Zalerion maritima TaxID=339359 RepID=A0AAD5WN14_9PEZI|nr:hypothetical protein MKZ38_009956 [Zalerion maritima]
MMKDYLTVKLDQTGRTKDGSTAVNPPTSPRGSVIPGGTQAHSSPRPQRKDSDQSAKSAKSDQAKYLKEMGGPFNDETQETLNPGAKKRRREESEESADDNSPHIDTETDFGMLEENARKVDKESGHGRKRHKAKEREGAKKAIREWEPFGSRARSPTSTSQKEHPKQTASAVPSLLPIAPTAGRTVLFPPPNPSVPGAGPVPTAPASTAAPFISPSSQVNAPTAMAPPTVITEGELERQQRAPAEPSATAAAAAATPCLAASPVREREPGATPTPRGYAERHSSPGPGSRQPRRHSSPHRSKSSERPPSPRT